MVATIAVSYWMIGAYVGFVTVSTLLVGLLPPLVNLPPCKDDGTSRLEPNVAETLNKVVENFAQPEVQLGILSREKRWNSYYDLCIFTKRVWRLNWLFFYFYQFRSDKSVELRELFARSERNLKNAMDNDPLFASLYQPRDQSRLTICGELLFPVETEEYPWEDPRLPSYIKPINYNINLLLSNINFDIYNGYINSTFDITTGTNLIIFHNSGNDIPLLQFFQDKNGNEMEIECVGAYFENRRDYFIIRTVA